MSLNVVAAEAWVAVMTMAAAASEERSDLIVVAPFLKPVLGPDDELASRAIDEGVVHLVGGVGEVVDADHEAKALGDGGSGAHAEHAVAEGAAGPDAVIGHVERAQTVLRAGEVEHRLAPERTRA